MTILLHYIIDATAVSIYIEAPRLRNVSVDPSLPHDAFFEQYSIYNCYSLRRFVSCWSYCVHMFHVERS